MYIIQLNANADGSRPAIQSWDESWDIPEGYAVCPEEFHEVFYSTTPAGFVNITVEDNVVTAMEVNQAAYDAYVAEHPPMPEPEPEPTADEILNTMLGVTM